MHEDGNMLHQTPHVIQNVGVHTAKQGQNHPLHRDAFWELMYLRNGHITCLQQEQKVSMHPGMAILHPPGVPHADFATTAYRTFYVWIDAPEQMTWPQVLYDDDDQCLERLCYLLSSEWRAGAPERAKMLELMGAQLSILIDRHANAHEPSPGQSAVLAAEQVITADFRTPLTVAQIARNVGVSTSALYRHFAEQKGQTPMEYLWEVRLRYALAHLQHSTLTLANIASLCGFYSSSHFSRHIKAATGKSPGRVRAESQLQDVGRNKDSKANGADF